jgi:glycosyltransferase involved in cell wall biosynthesis
MKRILIFSVAYIPFIGGAEIAVKEITDRIDDVDFDMITLNLDGKQKPQEKIGKVMVYRIGSTGKFSKFVFPFTAARLATRLHKDRSYVAIWSIMASFGGFAGLFFKERFPEVPFLLTLQEGDPLDEIKRKVRFVWPLFKKIFTKADRIQTISTYLAGFAHDMHATAPVTVIPNGVALDLFSKPADENFVATLHKKWNVEAGDTVLITTSRLVEKNAVDDIIAALLLLPKTTKLIIVGIGPLESNLRNQVTTLGLTDRVFFEGFVHYSNIPNYLAASTIFIRPSRSEGMGNSFIEAMAAGIPVIATRVGGIPDFLTDGETGLFCEVNNPQSIQETVEKLTVDQTLRTHLIQTARERVQDFDWAKIARRMHDEFL